jgi:GntR family carbon starvation induced transcriptional regulator
VTEQAAESATLGEAAFRQLRADILGGKLRPGEKLLIERLRDGYAVGATPLREALSRLSSIGLVVAESQRGFRVAPVSLENLLDISRNRVWIEGLAVRAAIARGDRAWEAGIVAAAHRLRGAALTGPSGVTEEWDRENRLFHEALVAACGSPQLLAFRDHLFDMSDRYRRLAVLDGLHGRDLDTEHDEIMQAVLARDAARAVALLEDHILGTTRATLEKYAARPDQVDQLLAVLRREIAQGRS